MKIQFLTTYYDPFLRSFYGNTPEFNTYTYQQMLDRLLDQYFADTGALYYYATQHQFNTSLIIANCEPLQKQWAKENNISYSEANWQYEIALAQIKNFNPEFFYIESVFHFYGSFLKEAKSYCKNIIAWISTPIDDQLQMNDIDLVLSSTPDFVQSFRSKGIKSEYMLPAFDARIINHLPPTKKNIPFSFVGGWSAVHVNRKIALQYLVKKTAIQLWGYGYEKKKYSKKKLEYYINLVAPKKDEILDAYNGEVWGLEMYKIIQRSFITFNIHESLLNGRVGNMRMFEASGVGTMLLNDNGSNLADIFIPGKEIETYNNFEEAVEKINYYSNHPEKAVEIGKNAQARTLLQYNYSNYVKQLTDYIQRNF